MKFAQQKNSEKNQYRKGTVATHINTRPFHVFRHAVTNYAQTVVPGAVARTTTRPVTQFLIHLPCAQLTQCSMLSST